MEKILSIVVFMLVTAAVTPGVTPAVANEPPLAEAGLDQTVAQGDTVLLDGGGSRDPDGDVTAYEWTITTPNGSTIVPACPACAQTSFVPTRPGVYEVTLTVTDDDGATSTDTMYVTVEATSGPTVSLSGPSQATSGDQVQFRAPADAGSAKLDRVVWQVDGAVVERADLSGRHGQPKLRRSFGTTGDRTVTVTVVDEDGRRASANASVSVVAANDGGGSSGAGPVGNEDPTVHVNGPNSVAPDGTAQFNAVARDADGTVVAYEWSNAKRLGPHLGSTATHRFTEGEGNTVTIRVTVTDDDGATATATKQVDIETTADPALSVSSPAVNASGVAVACGDTPVRLEATPYHFVSDIESYSWSGVDSSHWKYGTVIVNGNETRRHTVSVTATSKTGETATTTYTFEARCPEDGPPDESGEPTVTSKTLMAYDSDRNDVNSPEAQVTSGEGLPAGEDAIKLKARATVEDADEVTFVFTAGPGMRKVDTVTTGSTDFATGKTKMVFPVEQNLGESGNSYGEAGYSETVSVTIMADGKTLGTDQLTITWSNKGEDSDTYSVRVTPKTTNPEVDAETLIDVTVSGTYSGDVSVDYGDGSQTTLSYDVSDSAGGSFGGTEGVSQTRTLGHTYGSAGTYTVSAAGNSKAQHGSGGIATITVGDTSDSGTSGKEEVLEDNVENGSDAQGPANDGGQANKGADTNDDTPGGLPGDTTSGGDDGNSDGDDGGSDGEKADKDAKTGNDTPGRDLPDIPSDLPGDGGNGNGDGNGGSGGPPTNRGAPGRGPGIGNDTPGGLPSAY
jgi:hypothetical protein